MVGQQIHQAHHSMDEQSVVGLVLVGGGHSPPCTNQQEVERRATMLIHQLTQLGIQVNAKKSMAEASQQVVFVGHQFNLQTNCVTPTNEKQAQTMLRIKHQEKGQSFQPLALAGLAGNLNNAVKSNVALQGFPQQVMRHAAQGVRKNCTSMGHWQKYKC